mmetsp:Transcript_16423/g.34170  ORF Transcript_16423/g.34170 Transcript_16423/m.34170 type:complete len:268 (+) Transcript_16423:48-851(+)
MMEPITPHELNSAPKVSILNNRKLVIHNKVANGFDGKYHWSWRSITRDFFMTIIPLFFLYKISTHPLVARLGNSPKQLSRGEKLEEMMRELYSKRKKDEQEERKRILLELEEFHRAMTSKDVGQEEECSSIEDDFDNIHTESGTSEDTQQRPKIQTRKQAKRRFIPAQKRPKPSSNKRVNKQIKDRRASLFYLSKTSPTPSSPPWSSTIASAISGAFVTVNNAANKGKETSELKTNQATEANSGKKKYRTDHKGVKQKISWKKHQKR